MLCGRCFPFLRGLDSNGEIHNGKNKMRKFIPLVLAVIILGCGTTETEVIAGGEPSGNSEVTDVIPDGDYTETYKDGSVKVKGTILGGERFGTWVSYHLNGNKASESEYVRGALNGKTVSFYKNGQIRYIGYYQSSVKSGIWQFFQKDGTPSEEQDYTKR